MAEIIKAYDIAEILSTYKGLTGQVKVDLTKEFLAGRIKDTEYADVYTRLMDRSLTLAFDAPLKGVQVAESKGRMTLVATQAADQKYVTEHIRPIEKLQATSKDSQIKAQTTLLSAQATDQEYVTTEIRPEELLLAKQKVELADRQADLEQEKIWIAKEEVLIKKQELLIAEQKLLLAAEDVLYKNSQTRFTERQITGFEDQRKQKMMDAQLNAWAMMFSSGLMQSLPPAMISSCQVDWLYIEMTKDMNLPPFDPGCPDNTKQNSSAKKAPCPEEIRRAEAKARGIAEKRKDRLNKKAGNEISGD